MAVLLSLVDEAEAPIAKAVLEAVPQMVVAEVRELRVLDVGQRGVARPDGLRRRAQLLEDKQLKLKQFIANEQNKIHNEMRASRACPAPGEIKNSN